MKLLEILALENDASLTEDDMSPVYSEDDAARDFDSMEDHYDGMQTVYELQSKINSDNNTSPDAYTIALIGMESIHNRLGIPMTKISLESDDKDDEEGDGPGFFSRVWTAIKNFFKRIWTWLTNIFSTKKDSVEKLEKKNKASEKKLEELIETVGTHNDSSDRNLIMTELEREADSESSVIKQFYYLNKSLTIDDLEKILHKVLENLRILTYVSESVSRTSKIIANTFEAFKIDTSAGTDKLQSDIQRFLQALESVTEQSQIRSQISGMKSDTDTDADYIKKIGTQKGILPSTVRTLSGYVDSGYIAFIEKEVYESNNANQVSKKMALYLADTKKGPGHIGDKENSKFKSTYDKSMSDGNTIPKLKKLHSGIDSLIHEINVYTTHYRVVIKGLGDDERAVTQVIDKIEKSKAITTLGNGKIFFMNFLRSYLKFITAHFHSSNGVINMSVESCDAIMRVKDNIIKAFMKAKQAEEADTI